MSNIIDFVSLSDVKSYLQGTGDTGTSDDTIIANHITGLSAFILKELGRGQPDDSIPAYNPFLTPVTYTEVKDGNGHDKMFLHNNPIKSVASLIIGIQPGPPSPGFGYMGYGVAGNAKYIFLRGGRGGMGGCFGGVFEKGTQNIQIVYSAGYTSCPSDLYESMIRTIALNYKRKNWLGLKSKGMANGAGNVSYADWEFPPYDRGVFDSYKNWTY